MSAPGMLWALLKATLGGFLRDKCTHYAAGVAYYVLLSLFPLAIFVVSVLGIVLQDEGRRERFIDDIIDALPLEVVGVVSDPGTGAQPQTQLERNLRDAMDGVSGFSLVGLFGLAGTLWAASGMFGAIRTALDAAWDTEEPKRNFLRSKLVDFAMIGGVGLLLIASLISSAALSFARAVVDEGPLASINAPWEIAAHGVSFILVFVTLTVLYRWVPDSSEPRMATVWPGAALGALLLVALNRGFALYVQNFGRYNEVYGTLGTVVVFLFWAYLAAAIVLLGAELAAAYGRLRRKALSARYQREPVR